VKGGRDTPSVRVGAVGDPTEIKKGKEEETRSIGILLSASQTSLCELLHSTVYYPP
jgi:hypothetical protein